MSSASRSWTRSIAPAVAAVVALLALYVRYRFYTDAGGGDHPLVLSGHPLPGAGDLGATVLLAIAAMLYGVVLSPWVAVAVLCVLCVGAFFAAGLHWVFPAYGIVTL